MIKASSAAEIRTLVDALGGGDDVRREAAIARIAVIGARAVDRLVTAYRSADREARAAILRALEPLADARALPLARDAVPRGGDEATAAIGVLRALLDAPHGTAGTEALDLLVSTALDPSADRRVRLAAFDALPAAPPDVRARVRDVLRADSDPAIASRAAGGVPADAADAVWSDALDGRLPDRPAMLREIVAARAATAPLSSLQRLVDAARARELEGRPAASPATAELPAARRSAAASKGVGGSRASAGRGTPKHAEWRAVRGLLHQALALRGSRVALYDLRETLAEAVEPLPPSFLAAVHVLGDASCLDALASALARAPEQEAVWRHQLGTAFKAVARREGLTRKHAAVRRALAKCPELGGA